MNALARINPFGPLLGFELTRLARTRRLILWRTLYALVLSALVVIAYTSFAKQFPTPLRPQQVAQLTQGIFFGLFALQAVLACSLTPRWMADAITNEKERQALPFLLLTDLSSREIILGKLAARLAQMLLFLLAGLPILMVLQFLGGVEPLLAVICYVALAATILSLGCLSMLCSVYAQTSKAASQLFGRTFGLYIISLIAGGSVLSIWPAVAVFPGSAGNPSAVCVQDIFDLLNRGNPFSAVPRFAGGLRIGGTLGDTLWPTARDYVLFHLVVAIVCGTWAVRKLRPVAALQGDGPPPASKRALLKPVPRPPIGDRPVLWKAMHLDIRLYRTTAGRAFAGIIFVLSFAPLAAVLAIDGAMNGFRNLPMETNIICRLLVTAVLCGMMVVIAAQTSACISRERSKRTLDDLLLTDLSTRDILAQKWLGSVGAVRWGVVWVAAHWLIGVLTGGLHVLAIPVLAIEWAVYAAAAASLGIYFAARMPTAQGANMGTGLVGFAGAVILVVAGVALVAATGLNSQSFLLPLSVSPPAALGLSAVSVDNMQKIHEYAPMFLWSTPGVLVGVVASGLMAWQFWRGACWWFSRTSGRI